MGCDHTPSSCVRAEGLSVCEAFLNDETIYREKIQMCGNSPACKLMTFEERMNAVNNLPSLLSLY